MNEDSVEYRIPQTVGEVADAINLVRQAGGPELDFSHEEAEDDWSWVEKFKQQREEEPEAGEIDALEALTNQDLNDDPDSSSDR